MRRCAVIDVAFATYARAPGLDVDDVPFGEACTRLGVTWEARPWDGGGEWSDARLVVLRSPWNYTRMRDEFLAWCERVSLVSRLHNPLHVVRANTEKSYLVDLAARGVPVVPTLLHEPCVFADPDDLLSAHGWSEAVFKPAISAGGWRTYRMRAGERGHLRTRVKRLLATTNCLVQPFLPSVLGGGERALVYLDGRFSHAVGKRSIFDPADATFRFAIEPAPDEIDVAERVLEAAGARGLLYARVDLVRDAGGRPVLLELELTEPRLFFGAAGPEAATRMAEAIARRL
jgi:hypothetical protein